MNQKKQISRGDFIKTLGLGLAGGVILSGCKKDDDSNNDLLDGEVQIKATPATDNTILFYTAAEKITIDWGDSSIDEYTPNGVEKRFTHEYPNRNLQTVSFVAEAMTKFSYNGDPNYGFSLGKGTLREIRFGKCTELKEISCGKQLLTVFDIENTFASLESLTCDQNLLTSLEVSGASKLKTLYCKNIGLTELNVNKNTALTVLNCAGNQLTHLDLSKNTELTYLDCYSNELTLLDLSKNTELTSLNCENNLLSQLDMNKNTALWYLDCSSNQLTQLNVSGCMAFSSLDCRGNLLSESALNALFESLPDRTGIAIAYITFHENPGTVSCDRSIYEKKNWDII